MAVLPSDYDYYQFYIPDAGETRGGVKTLSSVKPYLADDLLWFVRATFMIDSYNDARWKPLVGSFYTNNDGIDNWGLWLSPSYNLHFRVRGTSTDLSTSGFLNLQTNTWFEAWVSKDSDSLKIGMRKANNDPESVSKVISSASYLSINTAAVVTVAGWQNNSGEGFPGRVETVTIGKHYTRSLINDIVTSPVERGSSISIGLEGSIGHYSFTSSLTSSDPSVVEIIKGQNNGYLIYPLKIGFSYIQCIVLDTNGFYPPINTTYILSVIKSLTTATLTVSQSVIVLKYVLNSTFSFDVFGTNNTDAITRTYSSGSPSVVTIPNSSIANAQTAGVGSSLISVTQSQTTNFTSASGSDILRLVIVGQNGSYSSINMTSLDLSGSNLSTTTFDNCNLTGVNLYGVTVNNSTNFTNSNLSNVQSGRILGITPLFPSGYQLI
jgi:hypothetical protein